MPERRARQLAYSDRQPLLLDERSRREKAAKIIAVLRHFLGREDLTGLRVLDVGCSGGIIAAELAGAGAAVIGADIDEPGLAKARQRFGDRILFLRTDGESLPVASGGADVVVLNHIYEHVVNPRRLVDEISRVLAPAGVAYLGLGNRLGVMEPHYRLPFLSWLPRPLAHRYVRLAKRAGHYHERFLTRPNLLRLFGGFRLWDYTYTVIAEPGRFGATDMVSAATGARVARLPAWVREAALNLLPTYIWIATRSGAQPAGAAVPPRRLR